MNVNSATPPFKPFNLNQEIARLDEEIKEIKFAHQFFEFMERPRKVVNYSYGLFFGVIYWTVIGERFFTSNTEKKIMAFAVFFFATAAYCLIVKRSPDMYQNFSRFCIKSYLNLGFNIPEDDLLKKVELIKKSIPNKNKYLYDLQNVLVSKDPHISLDKIMRVYKSELGMTLPLELWRIITLLMIRDYKS